jgi:hypothetical protein
MVGGGIRGWWSVAHSAGWSYAAARFSGCGRGSQRGAGAALHDGYGGGRSGEVVKEEENGAPRWGVAPFIAARGGGRWRRGGGN